MNKTALIESVAAQLGSRTVAAKAVDAVLDTIVRTVASGGSVIITNFGTFEPVKRAARRARNPQTGEQVEVDPTIVPRFRPGSRFRSLVDGCGELPATGAAVRKRPRGGAA